MKTMKIYLLFIIMTLFSDACHAENFSLCFVHIGDTAPAYLKDALIQARLFNKQCPIYVLVNRVLQQPLQKLFAPQKIEVVALESIPLSEEHQAFNRKHALNQTHKGFWRVTKERFLYLNDFIAHRNLTNVYHLENDNMLYVDLQELQPYFESNVAPIAATFDNDDRVIAGFIAIRDKESMQKLAQYFADYASEGINDMNLIAAFKKVEPNVIGHLPIIMEEYAQEHRLISPTGHVAAHPDNYFLHAREIKSIFDAACIGQYLGGIDPIHRKPGSSFINESCIFNPSYLDYIWKYDNQSRKVPYAVYKGVEYRINNLHVHCKNLAAFSSTKPLNSVQAPRKAASHVAQISAPKVSVPPAQAQKPVATQTVKAKAAQPARPTTARTSIQKIDWSKKNVRPVLKAVVTPKR